MPEIPKLVNRGPAGLLTRLRSKHQEDSSVQVFDVKEGKKNNIPKSLSSLVVDIGTLCFDPVNARLHPERNLEAIKDSLRLYGQKKPLVVRKQGMIVVAGNGTLEAAKALGWTKIAASVEEMTEVEAAGYGLADNRTAELAKWDFEVVAKLDKLLQEAEHATIGWSLDELQVLRAADWVPPPLTNEEEDKRSGKESLLVGFTPDQYEMVERAICYVRELQERLGKEGASEMSQADCLHFLCQTWVRGHESAVIDEAEG